MVFQEVGSYSEDITTPDCAELSAIYTALKGFEVYLAAEAPIHHTLDLKIYVDNVFCVPRYIV